LRRSYFLNAWSTTDMTTLSLHDALPICQFENIVTFRNSGFLVKRFDLPFTPPYTVTKITFPSFTFNAQFGRPPLNATFPSVRLRSEEHTSELQSRGHLVCRLLLEKKKTT